MKKFLSIFIIFVILFNALPVRFIFSQSDDFPEKIDLSSYKLQCNLKPIEIEETEEFSTSTTDYITELDAFAGNLPKGPGFFESLIRDFLSSLIIEAVESILGSLIGKVPVGAPETNKAIASSIKEATKNVLASIKTSIHLALQDALQYFKFQLINKLNEFIYGRILKNYIKDIEAYRNFKIFLEHQRVFNRIFNKYKEQPCIPEELKGCLINLLYSTKDLSYEVARNAENSIKLMGFLNAFYKYQEFNIASKRICEKYEEQQVYKNLELIQPASLQEENLYSLKKPETYVAKIEKPSFKMLANIFGTIKNKLNFKKLLAQIYPDSEFSAIQTIFFDYNKPILDAAKISNCLLIQDRYAAALIEALNKEHEQFQTQIQQPGGLTFKPKTQCLKTWADVEYEEVSRQLEDAMLKGDKTQIDKLDKKLQEIKQKIEAQKDIPGEDPNCLIPGPTLSSPADYEKLKEQILTSPLEIFKSQERATNVLVAFIRSWLSSKLFKIIDKGFASLEARSSSNSSYMADIKNAYRPERVNVVCNEFQVVSIPGSQQVCKSAMESQLRKITEIEKGNLIGLNSRVINIVKAINQLMNNIQDYTSTSERSKNEIDNIIQKLKEEQTTESIERLNEIVYNFKNLENELNEISNSISSNTTTLEKLINQNILNQIDSITASYTEKINKLDEQINSIKSQIDNLIREINSKISQSLYGASNLYSNKIAIFFERYIDLERPPLDLDDNYFPRDYIAVATGTKIYRVGEGTKYTDCAPSLGKREKLSFFNDFYPTHITNCMKDKDYEFFRRRFHYSQLDTDFHDGTDWKYGYQQPEYKIYFIVHDLIHIFYSLYNSPASKSGIQQENLVMASYNFLTNLITNPPSTTPEAIQNDLNKLYDYFNALENYASNTMEYAKRTNILEWEFAISKVPNKWSAEKGEAIYLRMDESLELILKTSKAFKEVIELYRNSTQQNQDFWTKLQELNNLQQQKDQLIQEMQKETDKIWEDYLSQFKPEEIQSIQTNIEQNLDRINEKIEEINNLCEEYNSLIDKIEEEINNKLIQQQEEELPAEESTSQSLPEKTQRVSLIKRIFNIGVGFLANIFEIINIFKPKKIYIK